MKISHCLSVIPWYRCCSPPSSTTKSLSLVRVLNLDNLRLACHKRLNHEPPRYSGTDGAQHCFVLLPQPCACLEGKRQVIESLSDRCKCVICSSAQLCRPNITLPPLPTAAFCSRDFATSLLVHLCRPLLDLCPSLLCAPWLRCTHRHPDPLLDSALFC